MSKQADTYSAQRECRILKSQGYTDAELLDRGFDQNTIQRSIVSTGGKRGSCIPTNRCARCGWKVYYLRKGDTCRACVLLHRLETEGRIVECGIEAPVVVETVAVPKTFSHPSLLGS